VTSIFRTDDQKMFADSLARFFADSYDIPKRRKLVASEPGYDPAHWRALAELGAMGVALPEAHGGSGGGPLDTAIVMEAIGASLFASPYLATVLGASVLQQAGGKLAEQQLPAIAEGKRKLALAYAEPQARYTLEDVATAARGDGGGYRLEGKKSVVLHASSADALIVPARTAGGQREARGVTLFLVDAKASGIDRRDYATVDGQRASDIALSGVKVGKDAVIGAIDGGLPLLEAMAERGIAALGAEAAGAMWYLYETTLGYMKTRQQFGATIGSFQALQHRMVDVYTACENAKSAALAAALALAEKDPAARARRISGAKLQIDKLARHVAQEAIQLHGGMGMTDELSVGHYAKRLTMIGRTFGDGNFHMARYTAAMRAA
jgi:alkylation response protein AidB-like acyl-CoA dehydrogenase